MASVEYHKTYQTLWLTIICLGAILIGFGAVTTHQSHVADLKYANEQMIACIQSDRPAADCRLMVYGSK